MKTLLVIFGITGDLSSRKLLPALASLQQTEACGDLSILGISRREVDMDQLLGQHDSLKASVATHTMDVASLDAYGGLAEVVAGYGADQTLFYLAVPPGAAADIVDFLGQAGLNKPMHKVLFEKPFGYDLESAREFIARTSRYFAEDQVRRIDHYMAKDVAQHVLALRRQAESHHRFWSRDSVSEIRVVATESIDIEGRGQFYEQTGALRDFVQGHLMQLLSLALIREPVHGNLPAERLEALRQIQPADPGRSARAQYVGYADEVGNPGSRVETFVSLVLESSDPAWQGIPLRIMTGKALSEKRSYVEVQYQDGTVDTFEEGSIQGPDALDAYARVLVEAITGSKEIFTTSDEVMESWRILAPLQEAWAFESVPLLEYKKAKA